MTDFKVYLIYNKVDTKDSNTYVGCTRQTLKGRFQDHKSEAHRGSQMVLHKYMREVGIRNFDIKLLEKYDSGCREEKESNWKDYQSSHAEVKKWDGDDIEKFILRFCKTKFWSVRLYRFMLSQNLSELP